MTRRYDVKLGACYGFGDFLPHPILVTEILFSSKDFNRIIDEHIRVENGPSRERYVRPDPLIENKDDFVTGYYFGVFGGAVRTIVTLGLITVGAKYLKNKIQDRLRHLETLPPPNDEEIPVDKV